MTFFYFYPSERLAASSTVVLPSITCVTTGSCRTRFTLDGETMSLPSQEAGRARGASAVAFVHSLNILIKYSRMYGFDHKRTESAFETTEGTPGFSARGWNRRAVVGCER